MMLCPWWNAVYSFLSALFSSSSCSRERERESLCSLLFREREREGLEGVVVVMKCGSFCMCGAKCDKVNYETMFRCFTFSR